MHLIHIPLRYDNNNIYNNNVRYKTCILPTQNFWHDSFYNYQFNFEHTIITAEYLDFQDKQAAVNKHRQDATQFSLSLSDQKILQMRHLSACGVSPKFTLYWCYEELHQEFRCLNYQGTSFGAYTLYVVLIQNSACKISNLWTRIALKTLNLYLKIPEIK